MLKEHVKKIEGVYLFREGMSAESMVESHPSLSLE